MANQVSDVLAFARLKAGTDSNGISDSDGMVFLNESQRKRHLQILAVKGDLFFQESYRDITSDNIVGGSSPGKILYPNDMFLQKNIQLNLIDPDDVGNWKTPTQVDRSNLPDGITWEWLKANQPKTQPLIDNHGDWFEIAPTPTEAIASSVKLGYFLGPTDVSATSDFLSYPFTLNWRILGFDIAGAYFEAMEDQTQADRMYAQGDLLMKDILNMLGSGQQSPPRPKGLNVGNNGWAF
jgi:hypothetical protein